MNPDLDDNFAMKPNALAPDLLEKIDAYWRAANYLSVGQIYLYDNPLLKRPLKLSDVKPLVVGHWGTTPGQNFIYVHLNRVIKKYNLDMFYVAGPGHGGPAIVGNVYLEGTWSEVYPNITQDEAGLKKLPLPDMTVSIGAARAPLIIRDDEAVPDEYCHPPKKAPDRVKIRHALNDGAELAWAYLGNKEPSLNIRSK